MVTILPDYSNGSSSVPLNQLCGLQQAGFKDADECFRGIDEEHVSHLQESDMQSWPALEVIRVQLETGNVFYAIIDGNHRYEAAKRKKAQTIQVRAGQHTTEEQVIEAAFRANLTNGRPASTTERSKYALWLFWNDPSEKPNLSAIARKAGLHPSVVNRAVNKELRELEAEEEAEKRGTSVLEITETERLLKAIRRYLENETAFFAGQHGERSVKKRASSLLNHLNTVKDKGKQRTAVQDLQTLALTLNQIEWTNNQSARKQA